MNHRYRLWHCSIENLIDMGYDYRKHVYCSCCEMEYDFPKLNIIYIHKIDPNEEELEFIRGGLVIQLCNVCLNLFIQSKPSIASLLWKYIHTDIEEDYLVSLSNMIGRDLLWRER